jgi:GT2 family glycosyltransferase
MDDKSLTQQCDITVIIPNWDGMNYLPGCLSCMQAQTLDNFEVIVVDNGSRDGSVQFIRNTHQWITLIELPENIGFAAACNIGIHSARGRYVAVLNNDTEADPHWIQGLVSAADTDKKIGMVASKILLSRESREIDSVGMLMYPDGIGKQRGRGEIDRGQFDEKKEILFPSACAALYRKEMLQQIGLFDEDFFAYCEDTDLGLRALSGGWKAVLAPDAIVYHHYSGTGGKYSSFKAMLVERNRLWVALKNFPLTWLLALPFHTLLRYSFQLYGGISSRGGTGIFIRSHSIREIAATFIRAYVSAIQKFPVMIKKRKSIARKISSREFIHTLGRHLISASELALKD